MAVRNWSANPSINFGITIQHTTTLTGDGVHFRSKEYSNIADRPKLTIIFNTDILVTPTPTPTDTPLTPTPTPIDITPTPTLNPTPTPIPIGPILSISGNQFLLNGTPVTPFGVRVFKGIVDDAQMTNLINNLDIYKAHGVNSISISFQPGTSGNSPYDVSTFNADGSLNPVYTSRIARILDEAATRNMIVFVTYFVSSMDEKIAVDDINNTWLQNAVVNATNFLKPWKNVALYTVNEMGHPEFNHSILLNINAANVNTILGWIKAIDPNRITQVGQGSTVVSTALGTECGNSDFCAGTGRIAVPEINRPYVVIEYERQDLYTNPGVFTSNQITQAKSDAQATKSNGAYWFWHSAWHQIYPSNFDLGGDGSTLNPGVHWIYNHLANLEGITVQEVSPTPTPTPTPTLTPTPTPTDMPTPTPRQL